MSGKNFAPSLLRLRKTYFLLHLFPIGAICFLLPVSVRAIPLSGVRQAARVYHIDDVVDLG